MTNNDLAFLSRIMGAPFTGAAEKLPAWYAAAKANPEKRATGLGRIAGLLEMLPTEEDAARTPVEVVHEVLVPKRQDVRSSAGTLLGVFVGGVYLRDGECPCESDRAFTDCHGKADA